MPEKWTGELVGRMHNARITASDLAKAMGVSKAYISMILNGVKKPKDIQQRMEKALEDLLKED